jgi:hypothetical protein
MTLGSESNVPSGQPGPKSYPYNYSMWAYDANDLIAVKNGTLKPWEVVPYEYWTFDLPLKYPGDVTYKKLLLGAAAYDPIHHKVFLAQQWADASNQAVITVWGVNIPISTPSSSPTATSNPNKVGDLNSDGIVNSFDWAYMNSKWYTNDTTADLNKDGLVNTIDFSIMNQNWLK